MFDIYFMLSKNKYYIKYMSKIYDDKKKDSNIELSTHLINNNMEIENTTYGTGVIPTQKPSNKCWKAFLSKINKG